MFVPVVTKDMHLFQSRQPQVRLKNVRSRAQSLGTNLSSNGNAKVHVSANCIVAPTNRTQRGTQSVGALPTSAQLASVSISSNSRSPPKIGSFKKQLDPIVEGVAFSCSKTIRNTRTSGKPLSSFTSDNILLSTARKKHCSIKLNGKEGFY